MCLLARNSRFVSETLVVEEVVPSSSSPALQCLPTHRGKSGRSTSLPSFPARPSAAVPCGRSTDQPLKCAACTSHSLTVAPALRALYCRIYNVPPRPYTTFGFQRIAPFGEHADDPTSVCYEKRLAPGCRAGGKS